MELYKEGEPHCFMCRKSRYIGIPDVGCKDLRVFGASKCLLCKYEGIPHEIEIHTHGDDCPCGTDHFDGHLMFDIHRAERRSYE